MDPLLQQARNIDGTPRFYPPGSHPATQRLQQERNYLVLALGLFHENDPNRQSAEAALKYVNDKIAMFEELEAELKVIYFFQMTNRRLR